MLHRILSSHIAKTCSTDVVRTMIGWNGPSCNKRARSIGKRRSRAGSSGVQPKGPDQGFHVFPLVRGSRPGCFASRGSGVQISPSRQRNHCSTGFSLRPTATLRVVCECSERREVERIEVASIRLEQALPPAIRVTQVGPTVRIEEPIPVAAAQFCVDDTVSLVGNRNQMVRAISAIMTT
jgi:hypothetical protein